MKVAVHVRDLGPEVGGGHITSTTYSMRSPSPETPPRTRLWPWIRPDPPTGWDAHSYVSLSTNLGRRVVGKVRRTMATSVRGGGSPAPRSRIDALLDSNSIDLIWCLAAGIPTRTLPYVTTIWDLQHRIQPVFPEVGSGSEWTAREAFFFREIGQATAVIVGTSAGQAEVERFYGVPPERIRRLPHPTPSFALDPSAARDGDALVRYGLEPGYVLYPAQFWAHKNHVGLLHALKLLRDDHDVHLPAVFVGSDKGNEAHVRRVAESLGLRDQVHFLGFVPRSDLVTLYRHAFALAYVTFFGPENLRLWRRLHSAALWSPQTYPGPASNSVIPRCSCHRTMSRGSPMPCSRSTAMRPCGGASSSAAASVLAHSLLPTM